MDDWTDNGDGSWTDASGDIFDNETGQWVGYWNDNGSWTDAYGAVYDENNNPLGGNAANYYDGTLYAIPDGTHIDGAGQIVRESDGVTIGTVADLNIAAADVGIGGGNVLLDPDQFGDVFTVNGIWMGNIYGLAEPGTTASGPSGRGTGNTPGGAYNSGNFLNQASSGVSNAANIVRQLQSMLGTAQNSGASPSTVAALQAALNNAKAAAGFTTPQKIAIAAGALLALYAITQRPRAA